MRTTGRTIGKDGLPVRAIAFSSGGFDTAMQLGVVHALLTIQGKAPDVVVGVSAGAINAVALAEILQAGTEPTQHPDWSNPLRRQELVLERQRARIARFRQIFEAYLSTPRELGQAFAPDMLQVDASRPLAPVKLPIHDELERRGREKEVLAREGLIKLINDLLSVRLSFATLTRFVRGGLGLTATREVRSAPTRWLAIGFEVLRAWALLGANLAGVAWLSRPLLRSLILPPRQSHGATAATIIYAQNWLKAAIAALRQLFSMAILFVVWVTLTITAFGLPFVLVRIVIKAHEVGGTVAGWLGWHGLTAAAAHLNDAALPAAIVLYILLFTGLIVVVIGSGAWKKIASYNHTTGFIALGDLGGELFRLLPPLAMLIGLPIGVATIALRRWQGHSWLDSAPWLEAFQRAGNGAVRIYWFICLLLAVLGLFLLTRTSEDAYLRRLLARYDLADGILSIHPLKQLFIRLFDPGYYGDRRMDDIVDRALRDDLDPSSQTAGEKLIESYEVAGKPPITVGLMVANLAALREPPTPPSRFRDVVEIVPPETKVVNGLLAATAVSPLFPPVAVKAKLFIDGANVAFEATRGLLYLLRKRVNPESTTVHLYSVASLPFSRSNLPAERSAEFPEGKPALALVDVALRALLLQRFRDATLERRLTELFTSVIPAGRAVYDVGTSRFLRVWVTPVEPDQPLSLNQRLLRCEGLEQTRQLIAETVADGCRAALEVMVRGTMPDRPDGVIHCRTAVQGHLAVQRPIVNLPLLADAEPGPEDAKLSPGLPEVCRYCKISSPKPAKRSLVIREWEQMGAPWPHEYETEQPRAPGVVVEDLHFVKRSDPPPEVSAAQEAREWPKPRLLPVEGMVPGKTRPLVSLLFSGGVFRGVYQVGTLNALSEAGLFPDIIAGASVGSITAAMVAQTFSGAPGTDHRSRLPAIARIAATYLAIDRLVLTDRFADFVRGLTLRAAATRFSLSQADGFFRRYDDAGANRFDREARLVTAGLDRLFWLSPIELKDLVKAIRRGKVNKTSDLLRSHVQQWLKRMGIGNEVLGAEPLSLLITEHVLEHIQGSGALGSPAVPFEHFLDRAGICFLATTVNLTEGCLEILGEGQLGGQAPPAMMLEGLLASSAFPGVFRPRWSWEVMPSTNARHQYIDGGTMDNLPLDAVAQFLKRVSDQGRAAVRPVLPKLGAVPHLLFSASLEVNPDVPSKRELERYTGEWPLVMKRAKQLRYNKKLEQFAETQHALRTIYHSLVTPPPLKSSRFTTPLDLEVLMVRPRWLCGTFGFHPMLGFRRRRQAESIAHGCATALMELARSAKDKQEWADGWGMDRERLPQKPTVNDSAPILPEWAKEEGEKKQQKEQEEKREKEQNGECWYRPGIPCTFSRKTLTDARAGIPSHTIEELAEIHRACGRPETHQPRP